MQFLLQNLKRDHVDADGVEVYTDADGHQSLRVNHGAGRAVLRSGEYEVVLLRDAKGQWVPERNNWQLLACVLGAPGLATAVFGF